MPTAQFDLDGVDLEASLVPWDSDNFGFPVAQIDRLKVQDDARPTRALQAFDAWCDDHDVRLVSCRLNHTQLRASMALEDVGFRFVEMVHEPHRDLGDGMPAPARAIVVEPATAADLASIEEIAYSAFATGRFLLDWRLPPELSRRRYATWVRNSFDDPRHEVLKAQLDEALVGFFIVEHRSDGAVYWHLTAIAPDQQGKGIGSSLWLTMLERHRAEDTTAVDTTISAHNAPAINLYARLGFTFGPARMTFHWLRGPVA